MQLRNLLSNIKIRRKTKYFLFFFFVFVLINREKILYKGIFPLKYKDTHWKIQCAYIFIYMHKYIYKHFFKNNYFLFINIYSFISKYKGILIAINDKKSPSPHNERVHSFSGQIQFLSILQVRIIHGSE